MIKINTKDKKRKKGQFAKRGNSSQKGKNVFWQPMLADKQTEKIVKNALNRITVGVSILDMNMRVVWLNTAQKKWFPYVNFQTKPLCYKAYYLPPKTKICSYCPAVKTFKTGKMHSAETDISLTGKTYKVTANPVKNKSGKVIYVVETVENITKNRKVLEKLENLNRKLLESNKKLRRLSLIDFHTNLYNHRYLSESISREFSRAKRYTHSLSVIMLDIDYFKSINDVYGHQFGDLVLKQFASQLKRMVRRYDIVIRFGGEEFLVISPRTDRSTALILAHRILNAINLYNFGNKKHIIRLKVSAAVASYPEDDATKGMNLIDYSDKILNKVKEDGGDRVYSSLDMAEKGRLAHKKGEEKTNIKVLRVKIDKLTKRANQSLVEAIYAFAKTIKLKDHYTGEHVISTVKYAVDIAKELNLSREDLEYVRQAAILHDLGKIGISEKILLKKSKLTKQDFNEIKKHPQIAADIMRPIHFLHDTIPLVFYHHERWDGKGYVSSLKGEEIPIGARIIAIADVFQALTSNRPYRKAYPKNEAIKIVKNGSGTQFDPKIVDVFLRVLKQKNGC